MKTYFIPDLSKGLVDKSSKNRLTKDYKQKATEMDNVYIKTNNNVAKRPPLREIEGLENQYHVVDVKRANGKIYILKNLNLTDFIADEPDEIERRKIARTQLDNMLGSGKYSGHWSNALISKASDEASLPQIEISYLAVHDEDTKDEILSESHVFMKYVPNFGTSRKSLNGYNVTIPTEYTGVLSLDAPNPAAAEHAEARKLLDDWASKLDPIEYAVIFKADHEGVFSDLFYFGYITNFTVPNTRGYSAFNSFNSRLTFDPAGFGFSSNDTYDPGFKLLGESESARDQAQRHFNRINETPKRLIKDKTGIKIPLYGLNYTAGRILTNNLTGTFHVNSDNLIEENMNRLPLKSIDKDLNNLDILVTHMYTNIVQDVDRRIYTRNSYYSQRVTTPVDTWETFITNNPHYSNVLSYCSLVLQSQQLGASFRDKDNYGGQSSTIDLYPDIKVTSPATDINAAGTYLYTLPNGNHLFVAQSIPSRRLRIQRDGNDDVDSPFFRDLGPGGSSNAPVISNDAFPNGVGAATGAFGLTIYEQTEATTINRDGNGNPVFQAVPYNTATAAERGETAATVRVIKLCIDLESPKTVNLMNELQMISFYASVDNTRFIAEGMMQLCRNSVLPTFLGGSTPDFPEDYSIRRLLSRSFVIGFQARTTTSATQTLTHYTFITMGEVLQDLKPFSWLYTTREAGRKTPVGPRVSNLNLTSTTAYGSTTQINNSEARKALTSPPQELSNRAASGLADDILSLKTAERTSTNVVVTSRTTIDHVPNNWDELLFSSNPNVFRIGLFFDAKTGIGQVTLGALGSYVTSNPTITVNNIQGKNRTFRSSVKWEVQRIVDENNDLYIGRLVYSYPGLSRYTEMLEARLNASSRFNISSRQRALSQYSSNFVAYDSIDRSVVTQGRRIVPSKGLLNYSDTQDTEALSRGYLLHFGQNSAIPANPSNYIRTSNLGASIPLDKTTSDNTDPTQIPTVSEDGEEYTTQDIKSTTFGALAFTDGNVIRLDNIAGNPRQLEELDKGTTTRVASDSNLYLGADEDSLKVIRYWESVRGYTAENANSETTIGEVNSIVELLEKHKLIFISLKSDTNYIYCLSIGENRAIKGLTRLTFNCDISGLVKVDKNRIGLFSTNCKYYELDFDKDFSQEEDKYIDVIEPDDKSTYPVILRPLPIVTLDDNAFSVNQKVGIDSAFLGVSGSPAFTVELYDEFGRRVAEKHYKRVDPTASLEERDVNGFITISGFPTNGSNEPEIRIIKDDDDYIEISSIALNLRN